MNAKSEFIKIVKDANKDISHFIWFDAGISKIFKHPTETLKNIFNIIATNNFKSNSIFIPGCWSFTPNFDKLLTSVCWRFCGGFFIIPRKLVNLFHYTVCRGCEDIIFKSGLAVWEVNVWAYIEKDLPIHWIYGDHDDTIFSGIYSYTLVT
jgi:Pyruvate/2-oxoacid:ferredoxin oxidoreductase delta subunit